MDPVGSRSTQRRAVGHACRNRTAVPFHTGRRSTSVFPRLEVRIGHSSRANASAGWSGLPCEHRPVGLESLRHDGQAKAVKCGEGGQVRGGRGLPDQACRNLRPRETSTPTPRPTRRQDRHPHVGRAVQVGGTDSVGLRGIRPPILHESRWWTTATTATFPGPCERPRR